MPVSKSDDLQPDAWLKLVIVVKDSEEESEAKARFKTDNETLVVSGCLALAPASRAALAEYAIWLNVQREVTSKRLDPWTSQYVAGRLHAAQETVGDRVLSELLPAEGRSGLQYWHLGKAIKDSQNMNTSRLASWLFDKVYEKTPKIVNELINKDRPTSAIVLARYRMFEVVLGGDQSRPICAAQEFPPERLIHHTLLRETGIWKEEGGRWALAEPTSNAAIDISELWSVISAVLQAKTPPSFAILLDLLAAPPWGVRAGPAGVWLVLYVVIHRNRCAVFERGTLVLELTSEHLQRMYKNPKVFELRELAQDESSRALMGDYREAFASVGCSLDGDLSFLELARSLYRWYARLPVFSQQTMLVSKEVVLLRSAIDKAQDPIKLLTGTLPDLHRQTGGKTLFAEWIRSTLADLGMANRRLQDSVAYDLGQAFGIAGPLSRIRNQLQTECAVPAADIAEARLKSFILRCTDLSLTDEKWLDSIGSLMVQRPLDAWQDETIGKFSQALAELCGQYKRWMKFVMQRGKMPRAAERFVSVTLTMGGGQEMSLFFAASKETTAVARSLLDLVKAQAKGNADLAASALAEALVEMQSSRNNKTDGGEADVDRKAR